jgi:hypothetical protein
MRSFRFSIPKSVNAMIGLHFDGYVREPVFVLLELDRKTGDRGDVVDLVELHGSRGRGVDHWRSPVPGQGRGEIGDRVVSDPRQYIGKPGLRVDSIEFRGLD